MIDNVNDEWERIYEIAVRAQYDYDLHAILYEYGRIGAMNSEAILMELESLDLDCLDAVLETGGHQ